MFDGNKPKCSNGHEMRVKQECSSHKGSMDKCYRCHLEQDHKFKDLKDSKGGRAIKTPPNP